MATTERGLWYLTEADDATVADLTEITKNMQDSVETVVDEIDSEKLDVAGGTVTGDIDMEAGTGTRLVRWLRNGVVRWRTGLTAPFGAWAVQRYSPAGVYQDEPLLVRTDGLVVSSSHIGGVWTGVLSEYVPGAGGSAPITLPTSPTDRWSVVAMGVNGAEALTVVTSGTTAWVGVKSPMSASATIHWQAVAY